MKYPRFLATHVEDDVDQAARAQAAAEDRTLSSYLRRIITDAVRSRASATTSGAPDRQEQAHV